MSELDFNSDRSDLIEYVIDKISLAGAGDEQAENYIEYLRGEDPDVIEEALEAIQIELGG